MDICDKYLIVSLGKLTENNHIKILCLLYFYEVSIVLINIYLNLNRNKA